MQQTAPQGQTQSPQPQPQRSRSPMIAGIGAALVASVVTLVILTSNPAPVSVSDQAATSTTQCQLIPRKLLVSTTTGSGTVRLRAGSYLSPPISLSSRPQAVVFPLPRPEVTPVEEVITIEGNANDVVLTSEVSEYRRVFETVTGVAAFSVMWKPMKTC